MTQTPASGKVSKVRQVLLAHSTSALHDLPARTDPSFVALNAELTDDGAPHADNHNAATHDHTNNHARFMS